MLSNVTIKQYLKNSPETIHVDDPVWKAWRMLKNKDVKILPVTKSNKIIGTISDRDIVAVSGNNNGQSMAVKEAMSLNPLIVEKDTDMETVLQMMILKDQKVAIVVNQGGEVVGLFSWSNAIELFLSLMNENFLEKTI